MYYIELILTERSKKGEEFVARFADVPAEYRSEMDFETFLAAIGDTTGHTNKLTGEGIVVTINGVKRYYDSFDINFRKYAHENWTIKYDNNDLSKALAVSSDGHHQFILEEKHPTNGFS